MKGFFKALSIIIVESLATIGLIAMVVAVICCKNYENN